MDHKEFSDKCRALGLTQAKGSQHLKVSPSTFKRYKNGSSPIPEEVEVALSGLEEGEGVVAEKKEKKVVVKDREQEVKMLKLTIDSQAKKIEALTTQVKNWKDAETREQLEWTEHADLQDAHAALSEVALNLWDRLASHNHPTNKPFTTWQGKEHPPVSPPKKYTIDPEDNIIPASQIPEVYTGA